jgi:hypothetical protein
MAAPAADAQELYGLQHCWRGKLLENSNRPLADLAVAGCMSLTKARREAGVHRIATTSHLPVGGGATARPLNAESPCTLQHHDVNGARSTLVSALALKKLGSNPVGAYQITPSPAPTA